MASGVIVVFGSLYIYAPNKVAPVIFTVAFALSSIFHFWQCFRYKCFNLGWLHCICATLFAIGYALREHGAFFYLYNDTTLIIFILSQIFVAICPPLLELSNYHVLGRVLALFGGVMAVVELLNSLGVSQAVNASSTKRTRELGKNLTIVAVALQVAVILCFVIISGVFHHRCRRAGVRSKAVKLLVRVMYASMSLILLRTTYRLVEYATQEEVEIDELETLRALPAIQRDEWGFYVFDATLMLVNSYLWNIWMPGKFLPLPCTDTNAASSSSTADNAKNTNKSLLQVLPNTGIASTPNVGGAGMLFYYQAPNGSVIEDYYAGNALTAESIKASGPAAAQRSIVNTPNIAPKAPLAAVSYQLNGSDWRHLFYVNNGGTIMETKTTDDNWTQPERVFVNGIAPGGQCLAACFGPVDQGIGLRVIAGLSDRVMGTTSFLNQTGINGWIRGLVYSNSTNTAGCACTVDDKGKAPRLHVYTRNDTNAGNQLHHMKQFPVGDWIQINEAAIREAPNMAMDKQSSLAVTSSGNGTTNWVFYQGTDGRMKQFITNSQSMAGSSAFSSWDTKLVSGSKLGATWLDSSPEGPTVLYQTDTAQVRTSVVNWNAVALANDTLRS
ncbi:hypothetical protein KVT40_006171 [Elsinoe batatas]|uniref:Fucose-specific lectin n=1 Tax=Elsinoe batatas TaxID=2601811 RepID=A0A8K0PBH0_9PEZI|nr:hypothetical protein KVT40_006171 [Elsinoe batatas]